MMISAPTPNWGQPPSTVTRWFVLTTLASTVSMSIGRMVRRFITWGKGEEAFLHAQSAHQPRHSQHPFTQP
ncbi:hypothetical protein EK904_010384 [Melospiza melodia maxima]|nr:hypothetical protein EK904_010384 [Melospiza melodia maxima]